MAMFNSKLWVSQRVSGDGLEGSNGIELHPAQATIDIKSFLV